MEDAKKQTETRDGGDQEKRVDTGQRLRGHLVAAETIPGRR
jgi:hypothetical protein